MDHQFFKQKSKMPNLGFTVIELMVTISIVVLVTAIVLVQYSSFNSSVLLNSQAYKIAFDLREAQSLGLGSRGQGSEFNEEYGLYFDKVAHPNDYVLFQDNGSDVPVVYNTGEAIGSPNVIDPRFKISKICVSEDSSPDCTESDKSVNAVAISFKRPNFDAKIYNWLNRSVTLQTVDIYVTSINDDTASKIIHVSTSGQITVMNVP